MQKRPVMPGVFVSVGLELIRFCPQGVGVQLADDRPGTGREIGSPPLCQVSRILRTAVGPRQIVGKPDSHALRAESETRYQTCTFTANGGSFASFSATASAISSSTPMNRPMPFQPA